VDNRIIAIEITAKTLPPPSLFFYFFFIFLFDNGKKDYRV
jgi:hypothetical protein